MANSAEGRTRTGTPKRAPPPQDGVSTRSTTSAILGKIDNCQLKIVNYDPFPSVGRACGTTLKSLVSSLRDNKLSRYLNESPETSGLITVCFNILS